jgi:hypothetical protein
MACAKICPKRVLRSSDDDGSVNGCILRDDLAPDPDDRPGHMHSGRVSAHGSREAGGRANVDGGTRQRARPRRGIGALCQSHPGKREAAPSEGIGTGESRGDLARYDPARARIKMPAGGRLSGGRLFPPLLRWWRGAGYGMAQHAAGRRTAGQAGQQALGGQAAHGGAVHADTGDRRIAFPSG